MSISRRAVSNGFALPTIVITSVVLFAVLVAALSVVTSSRVAVDTQFYDSLAMDAAESGGTHADICMKDNELISPWSSPTPRQLKPETDCSGVVIADHSKYLIETPTYRTYYSVSPAQISAAGVQISMVTGTVEVLRQSTGAVWRTHQKTLGIRAGAQIGVSQVVFGYYQGAFFATIGGDGIVRATGYNGDGQLGNGTSVNTLVPKRFIAPTSAPLIAGYTSFLSQGSNMFFVDANGDAYGAGRNEYGQLGIGMRSPDPGIVTTPQRVMIPGGRKVKFIAVRGSTTYFLTTDNNIYAAGRCDRGALGTDYVIAGCADQSTPTRVALPAPDLNNPNTIPTSNIVVDAVTAYVRMAGGRVYGWGYGSQGQLGDTSFASHARPIQVGTYGESGQPRAVKIVYDGDTLSVLDNFGTVKGVGVNGNGQMGTNIMSFRVGTTLQCLDVNGDGVTLQANTCNEMSTQKFRVRNNSTLYNAAKNVCITTPDGVRTNLASCDGSSSQQFAWDPDPASKYGQIIHVATGKCLASSNYGMAGASLVLEVCGSVSRQTMYSFNASLQQFDNSKFSGSIVDIATDQWALVALTSNGEVWSAGVNTAGELGNGTVGEYQAEPVKFAIPVAANYIYATNRWHTDVLDYQNILVVGTDGRVYGAGSNKYGQLGNGTTATIVSTPVAMNGIDGATVSAKTVQIGLGTTVVATSKGSIYTVGNNDNGQLGDGTTENRSTPIRAKYLNDLRSIVY